MEMVQIRLIFVLNRFIYLIETFKLLWGIGIFFIWE